MMRRILRGLRGRLRRRRHRPVILMYHRVASIHHDPWGLAVSPDHFSGQMAYLRQQRTPLTMEEFVDRLRSQRLPADAVAVTFDDGYRDNLIHAEPVLTKWEIPATVFLPTAYIDKTAPFWWDELTTMILASPGPAREEQTCGGESIRLEWGRPEPLDLAGSWRAWDSPRTARQAAYIATWRRLQRAGASERERVMESLRCRFVSDQDATALPMNTDEVRTMIRSGLLDIGAHTMTHPALSLLSPEECRREVRGSGATVPRAEDKLRSRLRISIRRQERGGM